MGPVYLPSLTGWFPVSSLTLIGFLFGPWTISLIWSFVLRTFLVGSFLTQYALQVVRDLVRSTSWDCLGLTTVDLWSTPRAWSWPWNIPFDFFPCFFKSCLHLFQPFIIIVCAHRNHLSFCLRSLEWVDWCISFVFFKLYFSWVEHRALAT